MKRDNKEEQQIIMEKVKDMFIIDLVFTSYISIDTYWKIAFSACNFMHFLSQQKNDR